MQRSFLGIIVLFRASHCKYLQAARGPTTRRHDYPRPYLPAFGDQESRSDTARLNTGRPGAESRRSATK